MDDCGNSLHTSNMTYKNIIVVSGQNNNKNGKHEHVRNLLTVFLLYNFLPVTRLTTLKELIYNK